MKLRFRHKNIVLDNVKVDGKFFKYLDEHNTVHSTDMMTQARKVMMKTYYLGTNPRQIYMTRKSNFLKSFVEKYPDVPYEDEGDDNIVYGKKIEGLSMNGDYTFRNALQEEIYDFMTSQGKYLGNDGRRKAVFASTGTGKTFLTIKFIMDKGLMALINCPDLKAIKTWKDEILKFTTLKEDEILILKGTENVKRIDKLLEKAKIVLLSGRTISSMLERYEYQAFENLLSNFGIIVHDEAHLNLKILFNIEVYSNNAHTLFLTATPARSMFYEQKILEEILPSKKHCFEEGLKERFNLVAVNHMSTTKGCNLRGVKAIGKINSPLYSKNILFNEVNLVRTKKVILKTLNAALKGLSSKASKVAIGCKTINECNHVLEMIKSSNRFDMDNVGFFNGTITDLEERFKETNNRIIITTDKSLNGIVNIKNLEAIILLHPIVSTAMSLQIAGRIRDEPIIEDDGTKVQKSANIFILVDNCFTEFKRIFRNMHANFKGTLLDFTAIDLTGCKVEEE